MGACGVVGESGDDSTIRLSSSRVVTHQLAEMPCGVYLLLVQIVLEIATQMQAGQLDAAGGTRTLALSVPLHQPQRSHVRIFKCAFLLVDPSDAVPVLLQNLANARLNLGLLFFRLSSDIGLGQSTVNDALVGCWTRDGELARFGGGEVVLAGVSTA